MSLKEMRMAKQLSQQKLANIMNVKQSTVSSWETKAREPDAETMCKLAAILGRQEIEILSYFKNDE